MTIWHLHLLNARNALTGNMSAIRATLRESVAMVDDHVDLPRFDLVLRAGDAVIPDWGIGGQSPAPGVIEITLMPERFSVEHLQRTLVHELHHLLRWEGPGYGLSLGEALVSEGLAGHFVLQILGGAPDPWDAVRPGPGTLKQAGHLWARRDFDFPEWFLGRGKVRKWTGYGIGHRLVAEHLAQAPEADAASLAWTPADIFRPALRRLTAVEGEAEDDVADADEGPVASRDAGGPAPRTPLDS
ncbi:DUF2268 domain-containing putative Zn-dependent protease [Paracoccus beibuensis]|uniref:DUF2268 domain-containing putative Zn-dependent protease n=1 Tax=Paracoccus beibuensis TaxID=547602 RepID=UPI00223FFD49|nr:DUF2268 domain-containing putative Zn-dependent protease [Paracoccus beibuensis]